VEIQTSRSGRHLWVSVRDTGVGIAPEHLEHVFERFWRADQSRSYWAGGSGLGLAIAQAIAKNHGGLISVTSQAGAGSCFTVRLLAGT
jgi:signal transduction histidine kinase